MIDSSLGMEVKLKKKRRAVFPLVSGSSSKTSNLIKQEGGAGKGAGSRGREKKKLGTETSNQTTQIRAAGMRQTRPERLPGRKHSLPHLSVYLRKHVQHEVKNASFIVMHFDGIPVLSAFQVVITSAEKHEASRWNSRTPVRKLEHYS